jgi:uncharacterized paraquat-inducible protein A
MIDQSLFESTTVTICPECDEIFRFKEAPLPLVKQCPHCFKKITIKKIGPCKQLSSKDESFLTPNPNIHSRTSD